jgi:hypothetical protein
MLDLLSSSGAYSQVANIMAAQTAENPPNHYVVVDYFLNLRLPREAIADPAVPGLVWVDRERERESGKVNIGAIIGSPLSMLLLLSLGVSTVVEAEQLHTNDHSGPIFCRILLVSSMSLWCAASVDDDTLMDSFAEWKEDKIGCDWQEDVQVCTIGVTTKYDIGGESGQIEKIDSGFGFVAGSVSLEAFQQLYIAACGGIDASEVWNGQDAEYLFHNHPRNRKAT